MDIFMKKTLLALTTLCSFNAFADWHLEQQNSSVSFTTFKKEHIAENHQFDSINAVVADSGKVQLTIDLTSVNTNIPIRDQRMQEHLFQTSKFANATFTTDLSGDLLASLKVGQSEIKTLNGVIDLHGLQQKVSVTVQVSKLAANKVLVTSVKPLLLKAGDFALVAGVNKLQELAGLPSISHTVPVVFTLNFTK